MNKKEIDRTILIAQCPQRLESNGGRAVGIIKNPTNIFYLFANEYEYEGPHDRSPHQDRALITAICNEINAQFGENTAVLSDKSGGSPHTYWREIGITIDNLSNLDPEGSGIDTKMEYINNIILEHINKI